MPSIKDTERLVRRVSLINLMMPTGLALTPMLVGPHGIGKTQIVAQAAKALGGYHIVVEGGSLKEGEITGLPFASPTSDGSTEVRFVPYYAVSNLMKLQKMYHAQAKGEGFLNGKIKLTDKGIEVKEGTKVDIYPSHNKFDDIVHGEINQFKFGNDLPGKYKLQLLESGEIKPVIFFIDELNRTEQQTMKELMNILLTRSVNGYEIPWWVSIVSAVNPSSQNSTYSTNEIDDAQRDRFLKLKVNARLDDWIDYALDAGVNTDLIEAIAVSEGIFIDKQKGYEDTDPMTPSPRSWEMVSYIYQHIGSFNQSKFLNSNDIKEESGDLSILINAKVGPTAGRTALENIKNKADNIRPGEIVNGKSNKVNEKVMAKFKNQKRLRQKITVDNLIRHIANVIVDFEKHKKSGKKEEKKIYINFKDQIREFVHELDNATQIAFAKKLADNNMVATDGKPLFGKISDCFATKVLQQFKEFRDDLRQMNNE